MQWWLSMPEMEHILTPSCAFLSHLNSRHRAFTAAGWFFCAAIISGVTPCYNRIHKVCACMADGMDIYISTREHLIMQKCKCHLTIDQLFLNFSPGD